MSGQEQEISVDQQMDDDEEEMQTTPTGSLSGSAPTSVIVSVTGDGTVVDSDSDKSATPSPSRSPQFAVFDLNTQRMLNSRLRVKQSLSDSGLKAKVHRQKYGQRLSPIPRRHELVKTFSVGAAVDTAGTSPTIWKPIAIETTSAPRSPTGIMDSSPSQQEAGEHPTTVTSTPTPPPTLPGATVAAARLPTLGVQSGSWVTAQGLIPSQEQLEAMHKQQIEMLALLEQQKHQGGTPPEMFQFPLLWTFGGQPTAAQLGQIQLPAVTMTTTTSNSSAAPSPTPSNASTDSGVSGVSSLSGISFSGETHSLGPQRRPLSESLSAPGFQTPLTDSSYETMVKQFQIQHQHILGQQQQLYQHYLEQQQRLMQQAMLERKHFEEQQRQLAGMHLRQQQQLQKQQTLLRQMQEQQVMQLQRQQQMLLLQTMGIHQSAPLRRVVARDSTIRLQYSSKPVLTATTSNSSSQDGASGSEMGSTLSVDRRSPSLTPKALLTPTNSLESNNGRTSPNVAMTSPSPNVAMTSPSPVQEPPQQGGTGLVYDTMMLKHSCNCGGSHPEHPGRLQSIWARLHETRVVQNCQRLRARKASLAELQSIHSENHVRLYGRPSQKKPGQDKKDPSRAFIQLSCGGIGVDQDTYWNDAHTSNASRMAAGSVIELADKVASGEIKNGFAFVRPPGHHSMPNQAMAFCYFNNVALAAKAMMAKNKRVMIVDWDIHHGNGTQQIFYDNPAILYLSIHRYDNGTFFPGTGRPEEIGSGAGLGFNVNIALSGSQNFQGITVSNFGDPEYMAAFRAVVIPIAREFNPDLILVSAGFNATEGHPPTLGGYSVTPKCYAHLTRMLMGVGSGRVAMALEGGYELMSLCASAESCMRALLGVELSPLDSASQERHPHAAAVSSIEKTVAYHKPYWSSLARSAAILSLSHSEAERKEMEADTVSALASLSMGGSRQQRPIQSMSTAV